jgi:hypothetical protein
MFVGKNELKTAYSHFYCVAIKQMVAVTLLNVGSSIPI